MIEDILAALAARDWYAAAVAGVLIAVAILKARPTIWDRLPRSLQWLPAVLLGAAIGFVDAAQSGIVWHLALIQAASAGLQIGLGAVGVYHASKRVVSKPKPPGGSSGVIEGNTIVGGSGDGIKLAVPPANDPPGAAMVAIPGLTVALMLAGCGSTLADEKPPCDAATLTAITAQCTAELRAECGPHPDESCEKWDAITSACDARIDEWEACE